jgi:DNA polymerase III delta prime subunit
LEKLKFEEKDCMDRLEKLKKELDLVRQFIDSNEEDIQGTSNFLSLELRRDKRKKDKEAALVEDTIAPLKIQLEKMNLIREGTY